jgi:hypothetical protein
MSDEENPAHNETAAEAPVEMNSRRQFIVRYDQFDITKIVMDDAEKGKHIIKIPIKYDYGDDEIKPLRIQSPLLSVPKGVETYTPDDQKNPKTSVYMKLFSKAPAMADVRVDDKTSLQSIQLTGEKESQEAIKYFQVLDSIDHYVRAYTVKNRLKMLKNKDLTLLALQSKTRGVLKVNDTDYTPFIKVDIGVYEGDVSTKFFKAPTASNPTLEELDFHKVMTVGMQCVITTTIQHGWYGQLGFGIKTKTDGVMIMKEGSAFKATYAPTASNLFHMASISEDCNLPAGTRIALSPLEQPVKLLVTTKKKSQDEEATEEAEEEEEAPAKKKKKVSKKSEDDEEEE